jgi:hypothetical protein
MSELKTGTRDDVILGKVLEYARHGWPAQSELKDELKPFGLRHHEISIEADCLLMGIRVIIPMKYRKHVLGELHKGHPGICKMKAQARSYVWWPGIDASIERVAKPCVPCLQVKLSPPLAPLHPWVWPKKPWRRIHIDFAGPPFNKMYFIVVDAHSKMARSVGNVEHFN